MASNSLALEIADTKFGMGECNVDENKVTVMLICSQFYNYGFCNSALLNKSLVDTCYNNGLHCILHNVLFASII